MPRQEPTPIAVEIEVAQLKQSFLIEERFTGLVAPRRTSELGFTNGGRVDRLTADIGDRVERGRTLAQLDVRALRAQLATAQANVAEARANYELALVTVRRQATLQEKGHVTQQRLDEAQAQANTALARIDAAEAQVDLLEVEIDLATLRAPFAGTVMERMLDEGAIAAPGQPVFELIEDGVLEARIGVPSDAAATLVVGDVYVLEGDRGPVDAVLRAKTGAIDAGRRTIAAVFDIEQPDLVSSGAVARLGVKRSVDERGFWAPVSALSEANRGLWSVYVLEREGSDYVAVPRLVEVVHSEGAMAFVRGAVDDGERFVSDGLQRLAPGQRVMPVATETVAATERS